MAYPQQKPTTAMVLSIIGGIFILCGGILFLAAGAFISGLSFVASGFLAIFGVIGAIIGLVTILGGVMLNSHPENKKTWGAAIIAMSIISWVFAAGGFVIGFILALIGGILALTWKPTMMMPPTATMPYTGIPTTMATMPTTGTVPSSTTYSSPMYCANCGAKLSTKVSGKCPACGANI
jgi:hypothetical protein